jgi:hypothetical protein
MSDLPVKIDLTHGFNRVVDFWYSLFDAVLPVYVRVLDGDARCAMSSDRFVSTTAVLATSITDADA